MTTNALSAISPTPPCPGRPNAIASAAATLPPAHDPLTMNDAITAANKAMQLLSKGLEFSVDPDSKKVVVRLVDSETRQVIRQFPSEEILSIARSIDRMQGLLLNHKA
jgi:flagellar protein FlaG